MPQSTKLTETSPFFNGWKEIANYLGKGVRTIQRYESQMGLPIRRPAGMSRGAVIATKAELDAWVSARPIRELYSLSNIRAERRRLQSTNDNIAAGLEQMAILRKEMTELGRELMSSLNLLTESVRDLCETLVTDPAEMITGAGVEASLRGVFGPHDKLLKNTFERSFESRTVALKRRQAS